MSTSYYRIQSAGRDVQELLDVEAQTSEAWNGREELTRSGVSVCDSLESLAAYLAGAGSGIPYGVGEWVIVELAADRHSADIPCDAADGERLVYPTAIVSVRPMDDEFFDLIGAAYDAQNS